MNFAAARAWELLSAGRFGTEILPYPLQRALMRNLSLPAQRAGRADLLALWAGQSAAMAHETDVNELLKALVNEVSARVQASTDMQR
jgi:nitronate monooxygenase